MYHGWLKKKTWNHAKERKKPEYPMVSAISKWWLWREDWKEKRKKVKIFACIFAFLGFYDDFWLWSRDIQFWRTLVFLAPAWVKCRDKHFGFGRREGKKKCGRKERKKEIIEDKNNYNSKIFDFTNKQKRNIPFYCKSLA